MSDQDIFNQNVDNNQSPVVKPEDLLASIKNENGEQKYKSVEDAIKGLEHSQNFISTLLSEKREKEEELRQLREQAQKQKSIEDVLKELNARNETPQEPKSKTPPVGELSEESIAALVRKELTNVSNQTRETQNASEVQNTLITKFGDKVNEVVAAKAAELGTSPSDLGELAKKNPKLVLSLFNASKQTVTPTSSSINLPTSQAPAVIEPPSKSLLLGASSNDQKEYLKKIKEHVYKQFNVQE